MYTCVCQRVEVGSVDEQLASTIAHCMNTGALTLDVTHLFVTCKGQLS